MSNQLPNLDAYWMPFTGNRYFKKNPRLFKKASGMFYTTHEDEQLLDAVSGLWCCNAGHCHPRIVEAVQKQAETLDYATAFQLGHPKIFEMANKLVSIAPEGITHAFFTNSGSEAVDTALKIALAYHRSRGEGHRTRLIGREKGYHGVGFGGISVGGMSPNRKMFGSMLPGVDHLKHTHNLEHNAYSIGQPKWGDHLADELSEILALHDPSTVAAVIMEPIAGSAGVLIPPVGYLDRIREICNEHGILLILDEVITGFGRTGKSFGAESFNVTPDIMTIAKGMTSGMIPMGGVLVKQEIYDTFMTGPEDSIEFFHGYTYSGHPLAAAAGVAADGAPSSAAPRLACRPSCRAVRNRTTALHCDGLCVSHTARPPRVQSARQHGACPHLRVVAVARQRLPDRAPPPPAAPPRRARSCSARRRGSRRRAP